jgi:3-isopropylmalate/(R)-2-methylmalate dehydratase small subunit
VVLPQEAIDRLIEVAKDQPVTIDLETMTVTTPFQDRFSFTLDPFRRTCLMEGLDEIGLTLARDTAISKFESGLVRDRPWIARESRYAGVAVEGAGRT